MSVDEKIRGSANDLRDFGKMFAERIGRKEQKQVSYDNPGTILAEEEFSALTWHIGEEIILVMGSYELGDEDSEGGKWNSPVDFEQRTIIEGLFGYRRESDYVLTHIAGKCEMERRRMGVYERIYKPGKDGMELVSEIEERERRSKTPENVLYVLTAWDELVRTIKIPSGEVLFENSHLSFYYRTVNWEPAPGLYDRGMDFHSRDVAVARVPRENNTNHFLARGSISDLVTRDLNGNVIDILASAEIFGEFLGSAFFTHSNTSNHESVEFYQRGDRIYHRVHFFDPFEDKDRLGAVKLCPLSLKEDRMLIATEQVKDCKVFY